MNNTTVAQINHTATNASSITIDMTFNSAHKLQIIVYSILMVISAIGNITILVILSRRRRKTPSRIENMLMHLAIADLMVTFLMMPLEIGWAFTVSWKAGDAMCRIMAFFRTFGLYLSSFVLVCISIDRYLAILKPLHLSGIDKRGKIMIFTAWMASCICSSPQVYIFHVETHENVTSFEQCVTFNTFSNKIYDTGYQIFSMLLLYALPLTIVIFSYASIYIEIFKRSRISNTTIRRSSVQILGRAKRRTLRMTITIVIVFIVCWTPYYIISIWFWIDEISANTLDKKLTKILFLFACTNSCMNPIVYGLFNIRRKRDEKNSQIQSITRRSTEMVKTDSRRTMIYTR